MKPINVHMPAFMDDKSCLLYVYTESANVHQSWLLPSGQVICYENIPDNYPSGSICTWDSLDDYVDAIVDVWWLNDSNYIVRYADELEAMGFPFEEEEEEDWEHGTVHPQSEI